MLRNIFLRITYDEETGMKNRCFWFWCGIWSIIFVVDLLIGCRELLYSKGFHVINGEYYRLVTGLFLHVNWFHLLANVLGLYFVCDFLGRQVNPWKMILLSVASAVITNVIFSLMYRGSISWGGSPAVFALIGLLCVIQFLRKDAPRFQLGTWYGNWTLGYAILGNIPLFSGNSSTLVIHGIAFIIGGLLGIVAIKGNVV